MDYIKIAVLIGSLVAGFASTYIFKLKKDNPVEQFSEKMIKDHIGWDIDLTPEQSQGEI